MKKMLVLEFSPLMVILLILSIVIPVGFTVSSTAPAMATVSNVTIITPTASVQTPSRINGQVPVNFTVGTITDTAAIDLSLFLLSSGIQVGTPSNFLTVSVAPGIQTYTYNLTIPGTVADGTYDVRVDARQPSGSGIYTQSSVMSSCVVINSTNIPPTPIGLLPASGLCYPAATPTFSWTAVTETNYTFKYNFQLATNTSFSSISRQSLNQSGVSYTASPGLGTGTYYWRVQAQDQYGNTGAWAGPNSICIDLAAPSVPGGLTTGSTTGYYNPTYSWTASTDGSACANIRYCVETSTDPTFAIVPADNATNLSNPAYTASVTLPAGIYYWHVRAYDCAGLSSVFSGNGGPFTINTPVNSASIPLGTGWNLFSLPICPNSATSISPAALLALSDNPTAVQIIWGYDCSSGWQYYIPGSTGTLTNMTVDKGYWLQASGPVNISITGSPCPVAPTSLITATLCPGWNLVGFKSNSIIVATTYFGSSLSSNISFICSYSGGWNCAAPTSYNLEPRKGYWVYYGGTTSGNYGLPCQ